MDTDSYLTKNADLITTVSRILFDEKKKQNPNAYLLPNAVDIDAYMLPAKEYKVPLEIKNAKQPIITFVGSMCDWSNDWNLLDEVSKMRPDWTFVLVGDLQVSKNTSNMLKSRSNILCVGQRPYSELPAYLINSDICFQCYRPARENDTRNSQKLFLYLAAGKPIVSTRSADVESYAEFVYISDDATTFVKGIENEIMTDSPQKIAKRREFAKNNSWAKRVETIVDLLRSKEKK